MDSWLLDYIPENSSIFADWILEGYSGSSGDDELILLFTGTTKVKHSIWLWHRNGIRKPTNTSLRADSAEGELVGTGVSLAFFCFSASSPISGRILQKTYRRQPSAFKLSCLLRCYHRSQVNSLTRRWMIWWDSRGLPSLLTLGCWQGWSTFVLALGLRTNSYKLKSPPSPLSQPFPGLLTLSHFQIVLAILVAVSYCLSDVPNSLYGHRGVFSQ